MNALTRDLEGLTKSAEACADGKDRFRQKLHLMPPTGWLNDPNGLCQFKGIYHAFFQYSPFNATGGLKMWGHYTSRDMIEWKYEGVSLYPDQPFDCHGVYSGSAFIEDGTIANNIPIFCPTLPSCPGVSLRPSIRVRICS